MTRRTTAAPESVWAVLADGWSLAGWVVGASRIRQVEQDWPAVGTRVHHSVGAGPVLVDDTTEVLVAVPGKELVLQVRGWPASEARVTLRLTPQGTGTTMSMDEVATRGLGRLVPRPVQWLDEQVRELASAGSGPSAHR